MCELWRARRMCIAPAPETVKVQMRRCVAEWYAVKRIRAAFKVRG